MSLVKTWTANLSEYETEELIRKIAEAEDVLKRLEIILNKKLKSANNKQLAEANYEVASWAYKQADFVGYQRALTEVMHLLSTRD